MLMSHIRIAVFALEDLNNVVNHDEEAYYERLSDFNTVNAGVNVDGICAENGDVAHVDVVKHTEVDEVTQNGLRSFGTTTEVKPL